MPVRRKKTAGGSAAEKKPTNRKRTKRTKRQKKKTPTRYTNGSLKSSAKKAIVDEILEQMARLTHKKIIIEDVMARHRVVRETAVELYETAMNEFSTERGYNTAQIQYAVENSLVDVVKDADSSPNAKVQAAKLLKDSHAQEDEIDYVALVPLWLDRIDEMEVEELDKFLDSIRAQTLDMLSILPPNTSPPLRHKEQ